MLEKQIHKDEKKETSVVKHSEQNAKRQAKLEAKALKVRRRRQRVSLYPVADFPPSLQNEAKAKKAVDKAAAKEAKYQKGLERATVKHNKAVTTLAKAQETLQVCTISFAFAR